MTTNSKSRNFAAGLGMFAGASVLTGAGALVYGNRIGLNRFTVRREKLHLSHISETGSSTGASASATPDTPLRVLHISDIHYVPGQKKKFQWLQSLAELKPDLIVNTGDNLSHPDAVDEVLEALSPLREVPGVFVTGSNDYYAPRVRNPLRYFFAPSKLHKAPIELPWPAFFSRLENGDDASHAGWKNLSNTTHRLEVAGRELIFSGIDDPHIGLDKFPGWPEKNQETIPRLHLAATHAPVSRALQTFADTGADVIFAGHTHGGQICLPGEHALVTNCDLPRKNVKGLSSVKTPSGKESILHVSAGIGTSAKAPVRLNCPPEATLLKIY